MANTTGTGLVSNTGASNPLLGGSQGLNSLWQNSGYDQGGNNEGTTMAKNWSMADYAPASNQLWYGAQQQPAYQQALSSLANTYSTQNLATDANNQKNMLASQYGQGMGQNAMAAQAQGLGQGYTAGNNNVMSNNLAQQQGQVDWTMNNPEAQAQYRQGAVNALGQAASSNPWLSTEQQLWNPVQQGAQFNQQVSQQNSQNGLGGISSLGSLLGMLGGSGGSGGLGAIASLFGGGGLSGDSSQYGAGSMGPQFTAFNGLNVPMGI